VGHYPSNQERTAEYLTKFDRERTLKFLIEDPSPVVFDVGANVGKTLEEFKSWWPKATVHCFEPQVECWSDLETRAGRYPINTVFVNKAAAGSTNSGGVVFYTHEINSGVSGFNRINLSSRDSIKLAQVTKEGADASTTYEASLNHERVVPMVRLKDYASRQNITKIHLLKIDTQGYEPEVLAGFGDDLKNVDVVVTELMFYDYYERSLSFSDIEQHLFPAGFRLYDISHIAKNPMNGRTDWVDVIYVNERLRSIQLRGLPRC
jgi:FkbM family methyltransferase